MLISASDNIIKPLETFQNQVLQIVTGRVKTIPVLTMRLLVNNQPVTNGKKNTTVLLYKLTRLLNNSF